MGRGILRVLGIVTFFASGLLMFVFWMTAMYRWLGGLGVILGLVLTPGAVVFPLVYWYVEDVFPTEYFAIWGVGLAGMFIAAIGGAASDSGG